jgi:hypothetical protein
MTPQTDMRRTAASTPWGTRRPGAALAAFWYLLVYTHLVSLALAQVGPPAQAGTCCCAAPGQGICCASPAALPDESMGCRGPRPLSCLFAAPCGGELPAAPQTDALTWPHLAASASGLQPLPASFGAGLPQVSSAFSLLPAPPDKVPKHLS